jgi:hypothetical protein
MSLSVTSRPRLTAPLSLRLAIIDRDGSQFLVINGEERDVTDWRQVTVTLINGDGGRCAAMVALDGEGCADAWVVEDVRAED